MNDGDVVRLVAELLDEYRRGPATIEYLSQMGDRPEADEFLERIVKERNYDDETVERVATLFFKTLKYERLLDLVTIDYHESKLRRFSQAPHDNAINMLFCYYAVFELTEETIPRIRDLMMAVNPNKALALMNHMKKSTFIPKLFEMATQIWDIHYVREILDNVLRRPLFGKLHKAVQEVISERKKRRIKEPTKPVTPKLTRRIRFNLRKTEQNCQPSQQIETRIPVLSKPKPIPRSTYEQPKQAKMLEEDKAKNKHAAQELYKDAQRNAFRVANLTKDKEPPAEPCAVTQQPPRPKKIPVRKEPSIQPKKTAAVILREGARLMKLEQEEIKRLDDIVRGGFNSESLKALEKDIQEERTRKHLEEIEKKHLQGLLTYEEALIAKQKYFAKTKKSADEFRREKEMWMKQLEAWRAEEQERIQESVEKGKAYERGAKEAVEHVKEEKHRIAMETMEESRSLKEKWLTEREEELKRKIQLIKEIKALQAFGVLRRRETAANATASIGLLCEMSTEELKERLMLLRMEIHEEIERRRDEIKAKKECRRAIVDGYRDLIEQHQEISCYKKEQEKMAETRKKSPVRSSSVEALKKKLDEKRRERLEHVAVCN